VHDAADTPLCDDPRPPDSPRYPKRDRGAPNRLGFVGRTVAESAAYSKGVACDNPTSDEALIRADAPLWWDTVNDEMASLLAKNVNEEVSKADLPTGCKLLPSRLILKIKRDIKGNIEK
jgi:hypothetical protein